MGLFDKAKDMASDHPDKVDQGLDKVGNAADDRTGNKYSDKIDKGENAAGDYLSDDQKTTEKQPDVQGNPS